MTIVTTNASLLGLVLLCCACGSESEPASTGPFPVPKAGPATTVCEDFAFNYDFNEGPTWVAAQGAFYFSNFVQGAVGGDLSGDIIKVTPDGECKIAFENVGTNGLAVSNDGNLLGATHKTRSISKFDLTTNEVTIVVDHYMDELLDSPNDLVQHPNGSIYFTNPTYELGGRPQGIGPAVFHYDQEGTLHLLAQGGAPNGIALSPENDLLYVVQGGIFPLDEDGVAGEPSPIPFDADGIAVDSAGNIYLSWSGSVLAPGGTDEISSIPAGTNLAFGADDGKTLLLVGPDTTVRLIPMNVPGLP
jgi:gluconolactonase